MPSVLTATVWPLPADTEAQLVAGADLDRAGAVGRGAVAQLPGVVVAPGPQGAVGLDRHRVQRAGGHRGPVGGGADLDRAGAVGGGAVAQLPVRVVAPGPQGAVGLDRHRVPSPAATEAQSVAVPTWTGLDRLVVVPSPSCPESLPPQAHRVPSVLTATVWSSPAATEAQLVAVPTWTGLEWSVVVPSPSCP